ncbi:MAG TPA: proteobacterial dedicated sortase system response regulator [Pseudomonadales bacterium]|jgi:two-component system OmpR family response regulator|nr:proteobacterial dedicated sortase system response regulator [Pseudomonadales bacterium]MDP6314650.1 proteobacterial dedicated sortase system response regulator [Pseudomonadales bacterium]MDP7313369.1 proteobacterial dedicated sortase system response regulator [Pseudomonadales bacterium]HJP51773.1 proteobacterial dedicated sortase system response regulator [Pseudomonadales bacterium]|tara:strand:- start:824 stop:1522 length:699 start_codon:yes stop_codon:yes gene_type:complete
MTYRIAIIEDDEDLRQNYADVFRKQGYQISSFSNRPDAQSVFMSRLPDLAIIDIGLGDEIDGGFALCQWLRQRSQTIPIIFLSARDSDFDIVSGLRMGADDYLTKGVSLPHLIARVAALFRRIEVMSEAQTTSQDIIEQGSLYLDGQRISCRWSSHGIDLTLTEFWMVYALAKHIGHVKNRHQLMQESQIVVDDATITSHIKRIRKKFIAVDPNFNCIDTVYGMGYRWNDDS